MPRSDSSSSRGRRTPSSKSNAGGRSSARPSGDKPFKKTGKPATKSFRKDSGGDSFASKRTSKSFGKDRDDKPAFGKKKTFGGAGKPFKKSSGEKPFGAKSSFAGKRNFRDDKPFKKFDDGDERPAKKFDSGNFGKPYKKSYTRKDEDERGTRKTDSGNFGKPYKKSYPRKDEDERSTRSTDSGDFDTPKKSYSRKDEGGRSARKTDSGDFDKPYKKSYPRKDEGERTEGRRSASFESRGDRPVEKFDKSKIVRRKTTGGVESVAKEDETAAPAQTRKIRLNKYIANSGVCSRREADELITMGLISVNGQTITELGYKVNPGDEVRHENKVLRAEKPVYILLNKPKGFLTTTSDPQERNTVMHLLGNNIKERVYPVGRLDRNTTGLLLLTNDGDLADKLMHPSYNVKKIYKVELDRPLTKNDAQAIVEGVKLEEGRAMVDDLAVISEDRKTVGLEIHIGWNRVVRRIFESLEYQVVKLDRSVYAGLNKKDLGRGEWRFLTKEELILLKHYK